ncbi:MAG: acylphosphatase [Spirochaetales bacterium]|nr:acylphosphatase [Spirochaetales bacterium]
MNELSAIRINVYGRVQGVGFRYTTQKKASHLGLTGWVRNELDGSVEICCEGEAMAITAFLDWLESGGPRTCRISDSNYTKVDYTGTYSRFSIEY